ncbi:MAG TPA: HAD hydrolase family protein [Pyrinomonadaceae bacterium]|nr:HAD hydrolase family protein [Pyrinomonadaceae bacterium]
MASLDKIKLLLMDCDGVLTDGRLYFSASGEEMKVFDVRDGQGIVSWHKAGNKSGIISGRGAGEIIRRRADELGIEFVKVSSADKVKDCEEILASLGFGLDQVAFIGDDIGDIEVMKRVGLAVAVGDGVDAAKKVASYVTKAPGGRGAVREVIDMILDVQKK